MPVVLGENVRGGTCGCAGIVVGVASWALDVPSLTLIPVFVTSNSGPPTIAISNLKK